MGQVQVSLGDAFISLFELINLIVVAIYLMYYTMPPKHSNLSTKKQQQFRLQDYL